MGEVGRKPASVIEQLEAQSRRCPFLRDPVVLSAGMVRVISSDRVFCSDKFWENTVITRRGVYVSVLCVAKVRKILRRISNAEGNRYQRTVVNYKGIVLISR